MRAHLEVGMCTDITVVLYSLYSSTHCSLS